MVAGDQKCSNTAWLTDPRTIPHMNKPQAIQSTLYSGSTRNQFRSYEGSPMAPVCPFAQGCNLIFHPEVVYYHGAIQLLPGTDHNY